MNLDSMQERIEGIMIGEIDEQKKLKMRAMQERLNSLWKQEEIFWQQRSHVKWLQEGDHNTNFFHNTTIQRR